MDKKDKRNSFLDKVVRNTVRIGKDKSSKTKDVKAATWSSRNQLPSSGDSDPSNGTQYGFGPSPQDNIKNLSDKEVLERFEQLLTWTYMNSNDECNTITRGDGNSIVPC